MSKYHEPHSSTAPSDLAKTMQIDEVDLQPRIIQVVNGSQTDRPALKTYFASLPPKEAGGNCPNHTHEVDIVGCSCDTVQRVYCSCNRVISCSCIGVCSHSTSPRPTCSHRSCSHSYGGGGSRVVGCSCAPVH